MGDLDGALQAYEHALRHNQWSVPAMTGIATILRTREQFAKAVEYLQNILKIDANNGEIWGSLGVQQDHDSPDKANACPRSLSFDDGQLTGSIHFLSAGTILPP
jgi:tetratricopeptide (TPR) repeat protein